MNHLLRHFFPRSHRNQGGGIDTQAHSLYGQIRFAQVCSALCKQRRNLRPCIDTERGGLEHNPVGLSLGRDLDNSAQSAACGFDPYRCQCIAPTMDRECRIKTRNRGLGLQQRAFVRQTHQRVITIRVPMHLRRPSGHHPNHERL